MYLYVTYLLLSLLLRVTDHCPPFTAHCQLSIRPQKKFPGAGPEHTVFAIQNTLMGACAGEVWAEEAPEGPASPKGFTGWGGPGAACGSPLADFSSGE